MSQHPNGPIRTYEEANLGRSAFGHDAAEVAACSEEAVELLRCCADGGDEHDEFGRTIEIVALELDCTLFVTLLARLWAQNSMIYCGEMFENVKVVLLDAALRLEGLENLDGLESKRNKDARDPKIIARSIDP